MQIQPVTQFLLFRFNIPNIDRNGEPQLNGNDARTQGESVLPINFEASPEVGTKPGTWRGRFLKARVEIDRIANLAMLLPAHVASWK